MRKEEPGFLGGGQINWPINMQNKINKGPEVYDPEALYNEYSRKEREEMTRFINGRADKGSRRFSLKIILLDILLLCIIGGIIYPYIVTSNKKGFLDGIACNLSLRSDDEILYISLSMKNPADGISSETVAIEFLVNGQSVKIIEDLTPNPGEMRMHRFKIQRANDKMAVKVLIKMGEESLKLNAASSAI